MVSRDFAEAAPLGTCRNSIKVHSKKTKIKWTDRWSLNRAPSWNAPPLAIANRYLAPNSQKPKVTRYRLILVQSSDFEWLLHTRNSRVPQQELPFNEIILFAYAADRTTRPTYVCLPQRLVHARSGRVVERIGPNQEVTSLPGIAFFDAWRVEPNMSIPSVKRVTYLPNFPAHVPEG
jgi:hypothetical protein